MLGSYLAQLRRVNPTSLFSIVYNREFIGASSVFQRLYIGFEGPKKGFLNGCRSIIGLDGCFLKTFLGGQLLSAVGRDENNQMFPIAWAVIEGENYDSWSWFLGVLFDDLSIDQEYGLTVISDQQKGLEYAIKQRIPAAEHRNCARHVYANWKKKHGGLALKSLFWRAVKCKVESDFQRVLNELQATSPKAHEDFLAIGSYVVNLNSRTCSCRHWDLSSIPYNHAIACITWLKEEPDNYIDNYYKKNTYLKAYEFLLQPLMGKDTWPPVDEPNVLPPPVKKMSGRPKKKRKRDVHEDDSTTRIETRGLIITCQICFQDGHNRRTCPLRGQRTRTEGGDPTSTGGASSSSTGRGVSLFDNLPEKEDLVDKFKSIQSCSENEINIEDDLISQSRNEWSNSDYGKFYGRTPSLSMVQAVMPRLWKLKNNVQIMDLAAGSSTSDLLAMRIWRMFSQVAHGS
ncbi:hypothetical protein Cni_G29357 [Canna indica]|uniref:SWIM-type domain-containing protein n=1 Tax=Canna indica TaxID=4628 RepID=A0AAQ3LBG7_9LILI|nr:hypothetical protein Cni_G29357 [Canna indica]